MNTLRLARTAMGSRWELVVQGRDATWLRAAGEEALDEVSRLDALLSVYRADSVVSRLNARAGGPPMLVPSEVRRLLRSAAALHEETDGAFDPAVGALMDAWDFVHNGGRLPEAGALAAARAASGMALVELDDDARTVRLARRGVRLDLGGIGKGFAVDAAVAVLREKGVERAFLHGGTSAVYGLGRPFDDDAWRVAVEGGPEPGAPPLAVVSLVDEALSVSAVWGKAFHADGRLLGHVLDPRTGRPVAGAQLAAVADPSATRADALSTALLVLARAGGDLLRRGRGLVLLADSDLMNHAMPLLAAAATPSPS